LLARSLVHDPSVLVLDEPTNGLDLQAQFQFFETASRLIDSGKTIVLVTHHLHEIPQEVSRLVLLKRGSILVDGPKEEVLTSKNLSELYEVPVRVSVSGGYFHATPGE
jgi:iron complex transport system ATP-binding protein